eukprot:scaffold239407_cov28-Tisochrysis_lutea.AAC.2
MYIQCCAPTLETPMSACSSGDGWKGTMIQVAATSLLFTQYCLLLEQGMAGYSRQFIEYNTSCGGAWRDASFYALVHSKSETSAFP